LNITFKSNAMGYRRNHAAVQLRGIWYMPRTLLIVTRTTVCNHGFKGDFLGFCGCNPILLVSAVLFCLPKCLLSNCNIQGCQWLTLSLSLSVSVSVSLSKIW
jgi:hypothetical protein